MAYQRGGRTDKSGNKYETNYFILQLLRVVDEEISSVTIEATGDDENGIDIWITNKDGTREGQQCKGRNFNKDKWTFSSINQYNILKTWKFQLERDTNNSVSIVTPISFVLLEDLISMAKNSSGDAKDFYNNQILKTNEQTKKFYLDYCEGMELDITKEIDQIKSLDYLKRTYYRQVPDAELKNIIMAKIKYLFCDDEDSVYNMLLDFVINNNIWGKAIDLVEIKNYINKKNMKLCNLAFDKKVAPTIDRLNREYDTFFIPINNEMIEREEYSQCKKMIDEGKSVIITGKAGYGKSGVVQLIVEDCKSNDIPYIAIKLDKRVPELNTKEWGEHLGLPTSISYCLDSISKDRNAVIILDQLDALRWTQANSIDSLFVCRELIEEVENINIKRENKISIILVCRSYDLNYDNNIKTLFKENEEKWNKIQIDKFSKTAVKEIVGKQYESNSKILNELLEIPSNLFIWTQLDKSKNYDNCYTTNKLIEEWWEQLLRKSSEVKIDNILIKQCINEIVKKMYNMSRISIIKKILNVDENALKYLSSNGFLFVENQTVAFTHQRILDYFLEVEMINMYQDDKTIEEIVGNIEQQTPSRRYQIQMFLEDLCDIGTEDFINVGKRLLNSENIRFYIKHVFFEVLGQIENIDSEIEKFILEFYNDEKYGKYIINNVIQSNLHYIKILLKNGILDEWIEDKTKIDFCIILLKSVSDKYDTEVSYFLGRHLFKNEESDKKIYRCFSFDVNSEIDEIFELRMKMYEKYPELSEDYIDFKSLFKSNEMRAIKLIKFWLNYNISNKNKRLYKYEEELVSEESEIIIGKDEEVINMLLPCIPQDTDGYWGKWSGRHKFSLGIERTAVNIIKKANNNLIKRLPEKFWNIYERYMGKGYPIFNELILEGFEKLDDNYSDKIIDYLCDDFEKNIFDISSGNRDELLITKRILNKHLKSCNQRCFEKIEKKIYYFYEKDSVEMYKRVREYKMNYTCIKMPWDWWGNLQVELIPFLPEERLNKKTKELYCILQRRFKNGSSRYRYSDGHSGSVWSPIAKKKLSDKQWIKLLSNEKLREKENHNWKEVEGGFIESNLREFATSFSHTVSNEPKRMIELILNNSTIVLGEFIDALYSGLQTSEKLDEIPIKVIEEIFEIFPCDNMSYRAQSICWILEKKEDTNWSNKTLEMLKFIAINHKDPILGKPNVTDDKDKEIKSIEMLQSNALNCTRGAACRTISHLLYNRKELIEEFKETIQKLSQDENFVVRFASLHCLYTSYYIDKEWSIPIILELFEQDDRFLSFWESRRLLFAMYKKEKNRDEILEIIEKIYHSDIKELKKIGALCAAEMYIVNDEYVDIMSDIQSMDEIQQEEIIRMIENYFNTNEYNKKCKEVILKLNNNNCDLENFISRIFYDKDIDLKRDKEFLIEITKSNSGRRSIHALLNYIEENALSILDFSQIILGVLKSFVDEEHNQENIYFYGDELSKLVVGLYDETEGKSEREMRNLANECLDIWDKMFERQIGTIKLLSKEILDR
jgi:hypothetical protein